MIKTQLEEEENDQIVTRSDPYTVAIGLILVILVLGSVTYFISIAISKPKIANSQVKPGNVSALPLKTQSGSLGQASNTFSLSNSPYNLQNNLPSNGSNQPKSSPIQSSNNSQNTGQSINPTQPY